MRDVVFPFLGLCLLSTISLWARGQTPDSLSAPLDSTRVTYFLEKDFLFTDSAYRIPDNTLKYFQKYDPAFYPGEYSATLGNIGLSTHNLIFSPTLGIGFDPAPCFIDLYRFTHDDMRFYMTPKPYTELFYVMGKYREQNFLIDHSQGIGKQLQVGLKFRAINSIGGYIDQESENKNVDIKTSFFTKNSRYGLIMGFLHNGLKLQENGGIKYDSVFEDKLESDPGRIEVNLSSSMNKWKEHSLHVSHYYSLTKPADTSRESRKSSRVFQPGSIIQSVALSKKFITYSDDKTDTLFFPAIYLDSLKSNDRMEIHNFTNTFAWTNSRNPGTALALMMAMSYQFDRIRYFSHDSVLTDFKMQHVSYSATLVIRPFRGLEIKGLGELCVGDYQKGNTRFSAWITKSIIRNGKTILLGGTTTFSRRTPAWFTHYHISNYFRWDNSLDEENVFHAGIHVKVPFFTAEANYFRHSRFIYFDQQALPIQAESGVNVFQIKANTPFHFKRILCDTWLTYQYVSSDEFVRVPALLADLSAYYNQELFKGALLTQLGFDLHYHPGYYANAYMPSTRVFYLQDGKKLHPLLMLDIVWKFQVKRTRFFLIYHHLNSLFGKQDYYHVPHYPLQDGRIKFGLSWSFHD